PRIRTATVESGEATANSVPDLARRAAIVVLGTIALIGVLSVFVRSPLEEPANPLITPNPAKAPWYFLWLQEIVTDTTLHIGRITINGAFLGGVILPGLLVALLTVWPWLDRSPSAAAGAWFPASRRRQVAVFLAILAAVVLLTIVGTFLRGPYWHFYWPWQPWPQLPSRI
ncbi:MAG TPA: cytochrome B6, partial [Thermoanaerobaculia bacterium]|nr:cytochrome B6 [Thermoanaerobaculia bacterium]